MNRFSLLFISAFLLYGCTDKNNYSVKSFKYYDETEVDVEVILKTGKTTHYTCAFPPNTDFSQLKKVVIGKMKSENLLKGPIYYCHIPS